MKNEYDLLYITFIDLNDSGKSGSVVRPKKMLEAFESLGYKVKVLSGWNNQLKERKRNVRSILNWLKSNNPKFCYVEPPSGPFFCYMDLYLLYKIHSINIPIGLFYRDAYWRFTDYSCGERVTFIEKVKSLIIKIMQQRDWLIFRKVCSHIFFPSMLMSEFFDFDKKSALPPGCFSIEKLVDRSKIIMSGEILTFIFVGGATVRYGLYLLLESFYEINKKEIKAKLIYVCPEEQWKCMDTLKYENTNWLEVYHISGDKQLKNLYDNADIAILAMPKTIYSDFAMPIKLFEYISYEKPIITTDIKEVTNIVRGNNIGWVVNDNTDSIINEINKIIINRDDIIRYTNNCKDVKDKYLWTERAKTVIEILSQE